MKILIKDDIIIGMEILKHKLWKIFQKIFFKSFAKIETENLYYANSVTEPVIFICNHLSNIDAVALNFVLQNKNPYYVSGIKLSENEKTDSILKFFKTIHINPNSADISAIKEIIKVIKSKNNVVIFPEGTRSRSSAMIQGKKGTAYVAIKTDVTIVPVAINGTEKVLPINDKDMGNEKLHPGKIQITFGKPYKLPKKDKNISKKQFEEDMTDYMMKSIAKLLPDKYRGFYA